MAVSIAFLCMCLFMHCVTSSTIDEKIHVERKYECSCDHNNHTYSCSNIKDKLPDDSRNCTGLVKIEVKNSDIKTLSQAFFNKVVTKNVTHLTLNNCNLSVIEPDALEKLPALKELVLTKNKLSWHQLSKGMNWSTNLSNLHLGGNPLREITGFSINTSMYMLYKTLSILSLTDCNISHIATDAFENFSKLTSIDLKGNKLEKLDFLLSLSKENTSLKCLNLSSNKIKDISIFSQHAKSSSSISRLEDLSLNGNPLVFDGPRTFASLPDLNHLQLQDVPTVVTFPKLTLHMLETLWLGGSSFSNWTDDTFTGLSNLKMLDMNNTDLSGLEEHALQRLFQPLSKLESLALSRTRIKGSIGNMFSSMGNLKSLFLDNNDISNISCAFSGLTKMRTLLLNNNDITVVVPTSDLPRTISHQLDLYNNPFHCTCSLAEFRHYLSLHRDIMSSGRSYFCHSPKEYAGKLLFDFNPLYSDCHGFNPYVVTAIVVCVVLIVVVLAVSLLNNNKHRIRRYWNARKRRGQYTKIGSVTDGQEDA